MKTHSIILSFFFSVLISTGLLAQANDASLLAEATTEENYPVTAVPEVIPSYLLDRQPTRKSTKRHAVSRFAPEFDYPELAREYNIEGRVTVRCVISSSGKIVEAKVVKGLGFGCDEAAVNALVSSEWTPAIKDGRAVSTVCFVPIDFLLQ